MQTVAVPGAEKCSADLYKDMPRSKAHIYDDLMARHWNYWDEGRYRHLFIAALTVKRETPSDLHSSSSRGSMEPTGQRPVQISCMSLAASWS